MLDDMPFAISQNKKKLKNAKKGCITPAKQQEKAVIRNNKVFLVLADLRKRKCKDMDKALQSDFWISDTIKRIKKIVVMPIEHF